ncbi:hypothetical protein AMS68_002535 [Peltaster fructicola]|uniref:Uncharacterized protein n=1 Tax=Peltaster fructicola TaxID=286661 RepID=A0A6H0XQV0_9PEZI|nr:hypothetical protein AMS68_002535 [Peltaster fructicola]
MPALPNIDGWVWHRDPSTTKWCLQQTTGSLSELIRLLTVSSNPPAGDRPIARQSISGAASIMSAVSASPPASPAPSHPAVATASRSASIRQPSTMPISPPPYMQVSPQTLPYGTLSPPPILPVGYMHAGLPIGPPSMVPAHQPAGLAQQTVPVLQTQHPPALQKNSSLRVSRRPVSVASQHQLGIPELPDTSAQQGSVGSRSRSLSQASFASSMTQHTADQTSNNDASPGSSLAELPAPLATPPVTTSVGLAETVSAVPAVSPPASGADLGNAAASTSPAAATSTLLPNSLRISHPSASIAWSPDQSSPPRPTSSVPHDPEQQMLNIGSTYTTAPQQPMSQSSHATQPQVQTTFKFDPNTGKPLQQNPPTASAGSHNFDPNTGLPLRPTTSTTITPAVIASPPPLQHIYTSPDIVTATSLSQASTPQTAAQSPSAPPLTHTLSAPEVLQSTNTTSPTSSTTSKLKNWAGKTSKWIAENPRTAMAGVVAAEVGGLALGLDLRKEGRAANLGIQQMHKLKLQQQQHAQAQAAAQQGNKPPQTASPHQSPSAVSTASAIQTGQQAQSQVGQAPHPAGHAPGMNMMSTIQHLNDMYQSAQGDQAASAQQNPLLSSQLQQMNLQQIGIPQVQQLNPLLLQQINASQIQQLSPQQVQQLSQQQAALQHQQQQFLQQYLAAQQAQATQQYNSALQQLQQQYGTAQQHPHASQPHGQPQYAQQQNGQYMMQQPVYSSAQDPSALTTNSIIDPSDLSSLSQYTNIADPTAVGSQILPDTSNLSTGQQIQTAGSASDAGFTSQMIDANANNSSGVGVLDSTTTVTTDGDLAVIQSTTTEYDFGADGTMDTFTATDVDVIDMTAGDC